MVVLLLVAYTQTIPPIACVAGNRDFGWKNPDLGEKNRFWGVRNSNQIRFLEEQKNSDLNFLGFENRRFFSTSREEAITTLPSLGGEENKLPCERAFSTVHMPSSCSPLL